MQIRNGSFLKNEDPCSPARHFTCLCCGLAIFGALALAKGEGGLLRGSCFADGVISLQFWISESFVRNQVVEETLMVQTASHRQYS